jgi:hypothetical protein
MMMEFCRENKRERLEKPLPLKRADPKGSA